MRKIEVSDLSEISVWSKKELFMDLFFSIHNAQSSDTVVSLCSSYEQAEMEWVRVFKGRAYKSNECWLRTYYNYLNETVKQNNQKSWIDLMN